MSEFREPAEDLNTEHNVQEHVSEQAAQHIRFQHQFLINHRDAVDGVLWIECSCQGIRTAVLKGSKTNPQMYDLHQLHVTRDVNERGPAITQQLDACERILGGPKGRELFDRIRANLNQPSDGGTR